MSHRNYARRSLRDSIAHHDLPVPTADQVRPCIGLPLDHTFITLAPDGDVDALCETYRDVYPRRFTATSSPFAEAPQVLTTLRERGYLLAVTTTKGTPMARSFVAGLVLDLT